MTDKSDHPGGNHNTWCWKWSEETTASWAGAAQRNSAGKWRSHVWC